MTHLTLNMSLKSLWNQLANLVVRASDYRLRKPGFESCAAVLKPWANYFTLHCSSSLSCINEYLAIDSGGYVYAHLLLYINTRWK